MFSGLTYKLSLPENESKKKPLLIITAPPYYTQAKEWIDTKGGATVEIVSGEAYVNAEKMIPFL